MCTPHTFAELLGFYEKIPKFRDVIKRDKVVGVSPLGTCTLLEIDSILRNYCKLQPVDKHSLWEWQFPTCTFF